ncbi:MAG TPA: nitrate- and nitrite sensing domain-containing protein [Rhodocyclaceae bacterium]|nr:nitrate- and nitrite sensing domain-containing protein [Rhodocyclaceae bacterium]
MTEYIEYGVFALVGLLAAQGFSRRKRGIGGTDTARQALVACGHLLRLIGHVQQHRGMSSAWLAGDQSFAQRLIAKRTEIDALFQPLQEAALEELKQASPCLTPNELSLFRFKWRSLTDGLANMSVEKSIADHSQLIATALDWLDAVGDARVALSLSGRLPTGLVKNYAHRLPALTECLGQARAIGSGVAAKGTCSAVARVRLMFLVSRAESLLDQACGVNEGPANDADKARVAVKSLAQLIRERMLTSDHVDVTTDSYFAQATRAIEDVFAWIRDCGEALEQRLV